jgi:hypothetical protein
LAHGAAALTEGLRRRGWKQPEVGDERGKWAKWAAQAVGQLGRCEAFGSGEEVGCRGLSWAKRPDGLGAMVGFVIKIKKKRKDNGWAAKDTRPN